MKNKIPDRCHDVQHLRAAVFRHLRRIGCAEFKPNSRVFVEGSVELVTPSSGARPWIDFKIDEQRCGRWFRVTYSMSITASGWANDMTCSFAMGEIHENYGYKVGVK